MAKGSGRSGVRACLIACLVLAFTVRAFAWWATWPTLPAGDEYDYFIRATRLATGAGLLDPGGRAPGAVFFYAGLFKILHPWAQLIRGANVLVGSLTVWPAFALGRRLGGARVGLTTAALVALYPTFIAFSHYLWSETLFVAFAALGLWLSLFADERRSGPWAVAAGAVLGLATLTREAGLLVAPACALWLALRGAWGEPGGSEEPAEEATTTTRSGTSAAERRDRSGDLIRAGLLLVGFALTLAPWTFFINEPDLPFTLVSRTSYMNLQAGNSHRAPGLEFEHYLDRGRNRAEREQESADLAFAYIRERGVMWPLEKLVREVPRFFEPDTFAARRARTPAGDPGNWGYRFRFDALDRLAFRHALAFWDIAAYVVLAFAGLAGLCLSRHSRVSMLFGLFIASQLVPAVITFSMTRFRLPSMLVFAAGGAALMITGREDFRLARPKRRAVTLLALAALAVCMIASVR